MSDETVDVFERAEKHLSDLCNGRAKWRMCIPARPGEDSDLIFAEIIRAGRAALAAQKEAEEKLAKALEIASSSVHLCENMSPEPDADEALRHPYAVMFCAPCFAYWKDRCDAKERDLAAARQRIAELENRAELYRERLDQFEAYGMPNAAAALDRVEGLEKNLSSARLRIEQLLVVLDDLTCRGRIDKKLLLAARSILAGRRG